LLRISRILDFRNGAEFLFLPPFFAVKDITLAYRDDGSVIEI